MYVYDRIVKQQMHLFFDPPLPALWMNFLTYIHINFLTQQQNIDGHLFFFQFPFRG